MNLKYLTPLLAVVASLAFTTPLSLAQTETPSGDTSSVRRPDSVLFGQNHYYSVIFRADGGAVVNGRVSLSNRGEAALSTLGLDLGKAATTFEAFQEINGFTVCPLLEAVAPDQTCPYPTTGTTYQSAQVTREGTVYTVTLPEPIVKDSEGTVVFGYRTTGYVTKKPLGLFNFTFTTPAVEETINTVNVAITAHSSLYLKDAEGRVVYQGQSESVQPVAQDTVRLIAPDIGSGGQIYKSDQGLAPGETLRVAGSYATSRWTLYWKEAGIGLGLLILLLLTWTVWRRWVSKMSGKPFSGSGENVLLALAGAVGIGVLAYIWQQIASVGMYYGTTGPLLMLIMAFAFLSLFAAPAIIAGARRGVVHAAYVLLLQVAFLFILVLIDYGL